MSKPVKDMMVEDYRKRFAGVTDALVVDYRGVDANEDNKMRIGLNEKGISITIVKNSLAKRAFAGTSLENIGPALDGPSALAYGAESVVDVARELVDWAKKLRELSLKGALLEGEYYDGEQGVKKVSQMPTRDEALANLVGSILSPARNLMGAITGPGGKSLAVLKEIQKKLEDGKEITKVA